MTHLDLIRYFSTASRLKKVPPHLLYHPEVSQQQQVPHNSRSHEQQLKSSQQQHHHHAGSDDKKSKKSKILEVISFKKSPSISSKEKEAKKFQRLHEPRPLEPVEIAHLETLKVRIN